MSKLIGYIGMMSAGKTSYLIDEYENALLEHKKVLVWNDLESRDGRHIRKTVDPKDFEYYDVVLVDELQFQNKGLLLSLILNCRTDVKIVWGGLKYTFDYQKFSTTESAIKISDIVNNVPVKCSVEDCDSYATQYIVKNGGGLNKENYKVVCNNHYEKAGGTW